MAGPRRNRIARLASITASRDGNPCPVADPRPSRSRTGTPKHTTPQRKYRESLMAISFDSPFHAHDLMQCVNDLDQIGVGRQHCLDRLVRSGVSSITSASLRHSIPAVVRSWDPPQKKRRLASLGDIARPAPWLQPAEARPGYPCRARLLTVVVLASNIVPLGTPISVTFLRGNERLGSCAWTATHN